LANADVTIRLRIRVMLLNFMAKSRARVSDRIGIGLWLTL
jgi:hypothetical protein